MAATSRLGGAKRIRSSRSSFFTQPAEGQFEQETSHKTIQTELLYTRQSTGNLCSKRGAYKVIHYLLCNSSRLENIQ